MNKASGGGGTPVELFQILKDDGVKFQHSICQQNGKFSSGHRSEKGQFSFQSQIKARQRVFKLLHNCTHLTASKVMLKILQAMLQQYVNRELQDVQAGFRKGRETKAQHPLDYRKTREFHKNIYFCFIDYAKAFDCVYHNNLWKQTEHEMVG